MPRISEMRKSRFLKKEDCNPPILVTIRSCQQVNVAMESQPAQMEWSLSFDEVERDLILKVVNMGLLEHIFASDNSDDWLGKKIVLYSDPNVMMGPKMVGGIRIRAPRIPAGQPSRVPVPAPAPPPAADEDQTTEDIPF